MTGQLLDASDGQESRAQGLGESSFGDHDDLSQDPMPSCHGSPLSASGLPAVDYQILALTQRLAHESRHQE
eukprot:5427566-Pyramimonas_sp.AAC.1